MAFSKCRVRRLRYMKTKAGETKKLRVQQKNKKKCQFFVTMTTVLGLLCVSMETKRKIRINYETNASKQQYERKKFCFLFLFMLNCFVGIPVFFFTPFTLNRRSSVHNQSDDLVPSSPYTNKRAAKVFWKYIVEWWIVKRSRCVFVLIPSRKKRKGGETRRRRLCWE